MCWNFWKNKSAGVLAGFPTQEAVTRPYKVVPATQESEDLLEEHSYQGTYDGRLRWPRLRSWLGCACQDRQSERGQHAATKDAISGIAESLLELQMKTRSLRETPDHHRLSVKFEVRLESELANSYWPSLWQCSPSTRDTKIIDKGSRLLARRHRGSICKHLKLLSHGLPIFVCQFLTSHSFFVYCWPCKIPSRTHSIGLFQIQTREW